MRRLRASTVSERRLRWASSPAATQRSQAAMPSLVVAGNPEDGEVGIDAAGVFPARSASKSR